MEPEQSGALPAPMTLEPTPEPAPSSGIPPAPSQVSDTTTVRSIIDQLAKDWNVDLSGPLKILEDNLIKTVKDLKDASAESWSEWRLPTKLRDELKRIIGLTTGAIPNYLEWKPPKNLVGTFGSDWVYQGSDKNNSKISKALEAHYDFWLKGNTDKQNHPLFLALSGAGTGKSRLLQEFPSIATNSVSNIQLKTRLQNALVFNLSFENGTLASGTEKEGRHEIALRMLYQLLGDSNFDIFQKNYLSLVPSEIIGCLAKSCGKSESDLTIILCVDGLQKLHHIPKSKDTPFYGVLSTLASLSNSSKSLVIPVCSATVTIPIDEVLADSPQYRCYLHIPPLSPKKIRENPSPLLSLVMDDMGGHGRALECLLENWNTKVSLIDIMKCVRTSLKKTYPDWIKKYDWFEILLYAVLSRRKLSKDTILQGIGKTIDDICGLGLFSYNKKHKFVECPYIWVWLFAKKSTDTDLHSLAYGQYEAIDEQDFGKECNRYNTPKWQEWEKFNGLFRCLKSRSYGDDTDVRFLDFHFGATFNIKRDFKFRNKNLSLVRAVEHYDTSSDGPNKIGIQEGIVNISDGRHFILSASGNPAGDGVCQLTAKESESNFREVHQYKFDKTTILTKSDIKKERQKSTTKKDIFILYTVDPQSWTRSDLPQNTGLVTISNSTDYYGPWAARPFYIFSEKLNLNINTMTSSQLQEMPGIGKKRAATIIEVRERKKIKTACEFSNESGIPAKIFAPFSFE